MQPPRFSIKGLMIFILYIALGLSALRNSSLPLSSVIFTSTLLLLCVATLGALIPGTSRIRWLGFAVFGWAYFILYERHWTTSDYPSPNLFTTWIFIYFQEYLNPKIADLPSLPDWSPSHDYNHYRTIGQCFTTLAFGAIGAGLGHYWSSKTTRGDEKSRATGLAEPLPSSLQATAKTESGESSVMQR